MITEPAQADQIHSYGQPDLVLLGREFLRNPYWPLNAARSLKQEVAAPVQYRRAFLAKPLAGNPLAHTNGQHRQQTTIMFVMPWTNVRVVINRVALSAECNASNCCTFHSGLPQRALTGLKS